MPPVRANGAVASTASALRAEPSALYSSTSTMQQRDRDDHAQPRHRALLVLELAAPHEVVTVGRLDLRGHDALRLGDHRADVAALDVELEREEPAVRLVVDRGAPFRDADVCELAQRHPPTVRGRHRERTDELGDPRARAPAGRRGPARADRPATGW